MTNQPDIDYHESAIETLTGAVNKLETEMAKIRRDTDNNSISLKEIHDWADEMHEEMDKHKKSDRYFQSSLKDTHKQTFEKIETLFKQVFRPTRTERYTIK